MTNLPESNLADLSICELMDGMGLRLGYSHYLADHSKPLIEFDEYAATYGETYLDAVNKATIAGVSHAA